MMRAMDHQENHEKWEIVKFILVLILAFIIATFPFWYPKEKQGLRQGAGEPGRHRFGQQENFIPSVTLPSGDNLDHFSTFTLNLGSLLTKNSFPL